jgi:hypothetical protein
MLDTKDMGGEIARQQDALHTALDAALPSEVLPQPGESALHYSHFLAYLAMGLHRGLYPLADARQIDRRWVERLSSRHHWRIRTKAWDDALQRKELREMFLHAVDVITREEGQAA